MLAWLIEHTPTFSQIPKPFGVFHLLFLGGILILFVLMVVFRHHLPKSPVAVQTILMIFGIGLLLLEIGKQLVYSYDPAVGWAYNWEKFPFQFCSTPIYVALVAMCLKKCQCKDALLAFLATYSPVAGASVLFYPAPSVFSNIVFLNVHTMVWHGAMLLFGLYLWLSGAVVPTWQTAWRSFWVYLPLNGVALALNELSYATGFAGEYAFNMFYIGRYGKCLIPVLSQIQAKAPYAVFFLSYVITLGMGGFLVTLAMKILHNKKFQKTFKKLLTNR